MYLWLVFHCVFNYFMLPLPAAPSLNHLNRHFGSSTDAGRTSDWDRCVLITCCAVQPDGKSMESQWRHSCTLGGATHLFGGLIEKLVTTKALLLITHLFNVGTASKVQEKRQKDVDSSLKRRRSCWKKLWGELPQLRRPSHGRNLSFHHTHSLNHKECVCHCVLVPHTCWSTSSKFSIPLWSIPWSESADTAAITSINSSALSATHSGSAPLESTLPARSNISLNN